MLKAFCSSARCTDQTNTFSHAKMVEKIVPMSKSTCPDCGFVLLWKKPNKKLHSAESKRSSEYKKHSNL